MLVFGLERVVGYGLPLLGNIAPFISAALLAFLFGRLVLGLLIVCFGVLFAFVAHFARTRQAEKMLRPWIQQLIVAWHWWLAPLVVLSRFDFRDGGRERDFGICLPPLLDRQPFKDIIVDIGAARAVASARWSVLFRGSHVSQSTIYRVWSKVKSKHRLLGGGKTTQRNRCQMMGSLHATIR